MTSRRLALISLGAGLATIAVAQMLGPLDAPPLYDGVVIAEPYRYLAPGPAQAGSPTSYRMTFPIENGTSPAFGAGTSESPPQAQLIAPPGAFAIPAGTTELRVSIIPVAPATSEGIVGNAYRFAVTNDAGTAVPIAKGSGPTMVLRAPAQASDVTIVDLVDAAWQPQSTQSAAQPNTYQTNVDVLGDFALRGSLPPEGNGLDLRWVAIGTVVAAGSVIVLLVLLRPRRGAVAASPPTRRTRVPRKRRRRRD